MGLFRHRRFLAAVLAGLAALALSGGIGSWPLRVVLGGDVFFLAYLLMTGVFIAGLDTGRLRRNAEADDEGVVLIVLFTCVSVMLSVGAILFLLRDGSGGVWRVGLAAASVPLGWLTLHTVAAFHYASLYYYRPPGTGSAGGLLFPGEAPPPPGIWDFLYFSFVVGMTAQVSDVVVTGPQLRRSVLAHGLASFAYNTVILALAVNAAVTLAG